MHPEAREFYSLEKLWDESLNNEQMKTGTTKPKMSSVHLHIPNTFPSQFQQSPSNSFREKCQTKCNATLHSMEIPKSK